LEKSPIKRIGVLTGGGDCPGLNAVIRAVTKTAMNDHGWEVWGIRDGFLGLITGRIERLDYEDVSNILTRGGTILGTSNKADPKRFAVATDREGRPVFADMSALVMENYRTYGVDAVVVIGGDGTMSVASRLVPDGFLCVGVPKTIDNDLPHCDLTFGFQTAVQTATEALDRIHTTASSHHRVMVVELMGRNSGWLTLYAGLASGADVILIPEIHFDLQKVADACSNRSRSEKSFTIIAVAEGARPRGGDAVVRQIIADSPDPVRYGGVGEVLAARIEKMTYLEARATVLGHVQRGGTPIAADRVLATEYGHAAVRLLVEGRFNRMVTLQQGRLTDVDIAAVADQQRLVPVDHPLIRAARSVGVSFGD
jgi:phosphofructokinase-like protein